MRATQTTQWTAIQHAVLAVSSIARLALQCVYPAAVILCLVRPGLGSLATPPGGAFQVLPPTTPTLPLTPAQP